MAFFHKKTRFFGLRVTLSAPLCILKRALILVQTFLHIVRACCMRTQNNVKKFQRPNWKVKLVLRQKCQTKLIIALFHTKLTIPGFYHSDFVRPSMQVKCFGVFQICIEGRAKLLYMIVFWESKFCLEKCKDQLCLTFLSETQLYLPIRPLKLFSGILGTHACIECRKV